VPCSTGERIQSWAAALERKGSRQIFACDKKMLLSFFLYGSPSMS